MTVVPSEATSRRTTVALVPVLTFAITLVGVAAPLPQQTVFRGAVDLIAVDVQVVPDRKYSCWPENACTAWTAVIFPVASVVAPLGCGAAGSWRRPFWE